MDIFRERVFLRGADESRIIALVELREEMEGASGGAVIAAPPARRAERPESPSRPERPSDRGRSTRERAAPERNDRSAGAAAEPRPQPATGGRPRGQRA